MANQRIAKKQNPTSGDLPGQCEYSHFPSELRRLTGSECDGTSHERLPPRTGCSSLPNTSLSPADHVSKFQSRTHVKVGPFCRKELSPPGESSGRHMLSNGMAASRHPNCRNSGNVHRPASRHRLHTVSRRVRFTMVGITRESDKLPPRSRRFLHGTKVVAVRFSPRPFSSEMIDEWRH